MLGAAAICVEISWLGDPCDKLVCRRNILSACQDWDENLAELILGQITILIEQFYFKYFCAFRSHTSCFLTLDLHCSFQLQYATSYGPHMSAHGTAVSVQFC